jgi:hypothetical protein
MSPGAFEPFVVLLDGAAVLKLTSSGLSTDSPNESPGEELVLVGGTSVLGTARFTST